MTASPKRKRSPSGTPWALALLLVACCEGASSSEIASAKDPATLTTSAVISVRDSENGRPIAGAAVTVTVSGSTSSYTSDARGQVTVTAVPGVASITITASGYTRTSEIVVLPSTAGAAFEALLNAS